MRDLKVTRRGDGAFVLEFTAPGDDHWCGTVERIDIAAADDAQDLESPSGFDSHIVESIEPRGSIIGGDRASVSVELPAKLADSWFAIRALDDAGNYSYPSVPVRASESSSDELDERAVFCGCGG
ncbi:MAG TPA: hypothetical protein ENF73_02010 [Proteobacteria bacterium]|nr:hypothetical protein [Pseudomonadota bacterium]